MSSINKILVLLESTDLLDTLMQKTKRLALATGAKVELFTCCYSAALSNSYPFDEEALTHAKFGFIHGVEKWLEEQASPLREEGIEVATDVYWERHTAQGMLLKLDRFSADLVLKDCRYHHTLGQHIFGNIDWELIRHSPFPLLLVRPGHWSKSPRIIACVDPLHSHDKDEMLDKIILNEAVSIGDVFGGDIRVFHSFQPLPASVIFDDTIALDYEEFKIKLKATHQESMDTLMSDCFPAPGEGAGPETFLAQGEVKHTLPQYVTEVKGELVVMGAVEHDTVDRFFVGGSAEAALDHLSCDVLIVKYLPGREYR